MKRYSVVVRDHPHLYDIVVHKRQHERQLVDLVCGQCSDKVSLGALWRGAESYNGWDIVVDGDNLIGPRLVGGFRTVYDAVNYAVQIRPDINQEYKRNRVTS